MTDDRAAFHFLTGGGYGSYPRNDFGGFPPQQGNYGGSFNRGKINFHLIL